MRNTLQFIEAAIDIFNAAHLKSNYLKACMWTSWVWIRGGVGKTQEQQNKEVLFTENLWYTFKHPCVFLSALQNIKKSLLETRL